MSLNHESCKRCKQIFTEDNPHCCEPRRPWCRDCFNFKQRLWCNANKELVAQRKKEMKARLVPKYRKMVWDTYGNACACCGEIREAFLTLEHKLGGGNKHRKRRHIIGVLLDIIRAGYPPEYCLYCMNCNHATRNGKPCPHELERRQSQIAAD